MPQDPTTDGDILQPTQSPTGSSEYSSNGSGVLATTLQSSAIQLPVSAKAAVMKQLATQIEMNDYGLPTHVYRADLIPAETLDYMEMQEYLLPATIELDYTQGFPTLPDGEPFWAKWPHEPAEAYRAFVMYLDMPRKKTCHNGQIDAANAVRQVHALKEPTGLPANELLTMSYLYFWPHRSMAYDLFISASHSKRREYMLQDVENEHLQISAKYLDYAQTFLDGVFADPDKYELKPSEAMTLLVKMIQVQRLSLGASPFGQKSGKTENEVPANAPLEVILRTLVQQAGIQGGGKAVLEDMTKQLLQNPDDLAAAQELIIKIGNQKNPRTSNAPAPQLDTGV